MAAIAVKNRWVLALRWLPPLAFSLILAGSASAQLYWAGSDGDPVTAGGGTWDNTHMPWSSTFPAYTAATWDNNIANFNGTGGGTVSIAANISVNDINFGANAGAFTLQNSGSSQSISILDAGITNNSGNTQTINNSGFRSRTFFNNSATAATATITNSGIQSATSFFDSATAANATITNSGESSATEFSSSATAANASITNSGTSSGTSFGTSATAANATITNSGTSSTTQFFNGSSGGSASLINADPTALIDISQLSTTGTTAGSIAGNGFLDLGSKNLTVGSNNTSAIFSGVIQDGGAGGGTGGSLTKTGTGTLTLSNANTYTGTTVVNDGTLSVNGSITTGVTVNNGGTLGGSGTTLGVTINSGGTLSPGNSAGILHVSGSLGLSLGANYLVDLNGTGLGTQYDQTDVTGSISLGDASLSLQLGFSPVVGTTFVIMKQGSSQPVSGTFNGLVEGTTFSSGGQAFTITYQGGDGNDVALLVVPEPSPTSLLIVAAAALIIFRYRHKALN